MSDPVSVLGFTFDGVYLQISLVLIIVIGGYAILRSRRAAKNVPRTEARAETQKATRKETARIMRKFGRL